jgi:kumamolisin
MAIARKRHSVVGSERTAMPGSRLVGAADPNERVLVTILLRRRTTSPGISGFVQQQVQSPPQERQFLTHAEFAKVHSADPADIEKVQAFAASHGLSVVETHPAQRRIVFSGTVATVSTAFGVYLARYDHPSGSYRGRIGEVLVPDELASIIEGVFGLDNRPQAVPHFRVLETTAAGARTNVAGTSYNPPQVAQLYDFPTDVNGQGQCIGLIELGGGSRSSDLKHYFSGLGIAEPTVRSVSIDGGHNHPTGDPNGPDGEVMLDIEVAGAIASGARIVVYFAPNTDAGFLDAIMSAIHDETNKPSVISISWGSAESAWTAQAIQAMDQAFQEAATLGVTVCCASGDDGSSDSVTDGLAHVDFPASSPYALACGGTRLEATGDRISSEIVWNEGVGQGATGGGISDVFPLPTWQKAANVPPSANPGGHRGRGVPDVSGDADPQTGYRVRVDGQALVFGGTSAVAPLWAGLIALMNQKQGRPIGYLNPVVYGLKSIGAFHDILSGSNGAYEAKKGWDACTGLGSPVGATLLNSIVGGSSRGPAAH